MDNAFTQILTQEIENLNLGYSQLRLINWKLNQFKKKHPNAEEGNTEQKENYEKLVVMGSNLIDNLKISITQIQLRLKAIENKTGFTNDKNKKFEILAAQIYDSESPNDKDLIEFITLINQIYINNVSNTQLENTANITSQLNTR